MDVNELIEKVAAEAQAAGLDPSPEELAQLALDKLAEAQVLEAIDKVAEQYPDAEPEQIAKAALELLQPSQPAGQPANMTEYMKTASFQNGVVERSREILVSWGYNPDNGERMSKVALARTSEEVKEAAALELLESKGWPVGWNPQYLSRFLEGSK